MKGVRFLFVLIGLWFVAYGQQNHNIVLLDNWTDTSFSAGPFDVRFNEVYGFNQGGRDYAVIGSRLGAHILAVDKNELSLVDFVPGKFQGMTTENRDYAVYENYLYAVCDEGNSTLQIIDLSYLPDSVHVVYDSDLLFMTAHTICIDENESKLYACGTNNAALKVIDISAPTAPSLTLDFNGVTYVHDAVVRNDTAFLNCGYDGLRIYNFGGSFPVLLGQLDFYANQGYNHSGALSPNGKRYAFTDETEGTKIKICELDNLAEIQIDSECGTSDYEENIPHELILLNNLLFCAYYNEGLRIYDLTQSPIAEIGVYDTYPTESIFKMNGAWGVYLIHDQNQILVSDRQTGVYLFSFPFTQFESGESGSTDITGTAFIDANRYLIPRSFIGETNLKFTVSTVSGDLVLTQQNYLSWLQIPLPLAPGVYVYGIYSDDGELLESGKFPVLAY